MQIVIRNSTADLADVQVRKRIERAVLGAIQRSCIRWPMRKMTKAEVTRRFNIAFEGYRTLRNDNHYSLARALDSLDRVLDEALEGIDFQRKVTRAGWFGRAGV